MKFKTIAKRVLCVGLAGTMMFGSVMSTYAEDVTTVEVVAETTEVVKQPSGTDNFVTSDNSDEIQAEIKDAKGEAADVVGIPIIPVGDIVWTEEAVIKAETIADVTIDAAEDTVEAAEKEITASGLLNQYEKDEDGNIKTETKSFYALDEDGNVKIDAEGNKIVNEDAVYEKDADGNFVLDTDGNKVMLDEWYDRNTDGTYVLDADGNKTTVDSITTNVLKKEEVTVTDEAGTETKVQKPVAGTTETNADASIASSKDAINEAINAADAADAAKTAEELANAALNSSDAAQYVADANAAVQDANKAAANAQVAADVATESYNKALADYEAAKKISEDAATEAAKILEAAQNAMNDAVAKATAAHDRAKLANDVLTMVSDKLQEYADKADAALDAKQEELAAKKDAFLAAVDQLDEDSEEFKQAAKAFADQMEELIDAIKAYKKAKEDLADAEKAYNDLLEKSAAVEHAYQQFLSDMDDANGELTQFQKDNLDVFDTIWTNPDTNEASSLENWTSYVNDTYAAYKGEMADNYFTGLNALKENLAELETTEGTDDEVLKQAEFNIANYIVANKFVTATGEVIWVDTLEEKAEYGNSDENYFAVRDGASVNYYGYRYEGGQIIIYTIGGDAKSEFITVNGVEYKITEGINGDNQLTCSDGTILYKNGDKYETRVAGDCVVRIEPSLDIAGIVNIYANKVNGNMEYEYTFNVLNETYYVFVEDNEYVVKKYGWIGAWVEKYGVTYWKPMDHQGYIETNLYDAIDQVKIGNQYYTVSNQNTITYNGISCEVSNGYIITSSQSANTITSKIDMDKKLAAGIDRTSTSEIQKYQAVQEELKALQSAQSQYDTLLGEYNSKKTAFDEMYTDQKAAKDQEAAAYDIEDLVAALDSIDNLTELDTSKVSVGSLKDLVTFIGKAGDYNNATSISEKAEILIELTKLSAGLIGSFGKEFIDQIKDGSLSFDQLLGLGGAITSENNEFATEVITKWWDVKVADANLKMAEANLGIEAGKAAVALGTVVNKGVATGASAVAVITPAVDYFATYALYGNYGIVNTAKLVLEATKTVVDAANEKVAQYERETLQAQTAAELAQKHLDELVLANASAAEIMEAEKLVQQAYDYLQGALAALEAAKLSAQEAQASYDSAQESYNRLVAAENVPTTGGNTAGANRAATATSAVLGANRPIATEDGEVLGAVRAAKTGDSSKAILWMFIMGASAMGAASILMKRKKENETT